MKKFIAFALIVSNLVALEFGQIGNTPASVGGAGVAYKKNAWAVYYNPALLGANRQASIAYSFSAGYADNNVLGVASVNVDGLTGIKDELNKLTEPTTTKTPQTKTRRAKRDTSAQNANTWDFADLGVIGSVLGNLTANGGGSGGNGITSDDLQKYLCGKVSNGGGHWQL